MLRFIVVHGIVGVLNLGLAGFCFYVLGLNHHVATAIGYLLHVTLGFYLDRRVTYQAVKTPLWPGSGKYLGVEVVMYLSIFSTMVITVDWLNMDPAFSRVVLASVVSVLVGYHLNKWWTFRKQKKQK